MKLFHTNVSTVLHKETRLVENIFQLWGKNVFEKLKSTIFSHSFIDKEKKKCRMKSNHVWDLLQDKTIKRTRISPLYK